MDQEWRDGSSVGLFGGSPHPAIIGPVQSFQAQSCHSSGFRWDGNAKSFQIIQNQSRSIPEQNDGGKGVFLQTMTCPLRMLGNDMGMTWQHRDGRGRQRMMVKWRDDFGMTKDDKGWGWNDGMGSKWLEDDGMTFEWHWNAGMAWEWRDNAGMNQRIWQSREIFEKSLRHLREIFTKFSRN